MSKYDGTKTQKNLEAAFAGESEARNKYTYFASVAKKEGFEQISDLFLKTANNEKEHAKCGLRKWRVFQIPQQILRRLPTVKITSGLICTPNLQKRLKKRAFLN